MQLESKKLSLAQLVVLGLSTVSPLCLYLAYASVAQASYGMVALVYLIGTLLMVFTVFSYTQYSKEMTGSGSVYGYISKGINPHVGFVSGWTILGYYFAVPALTYSLSALWLSTIIPQVPTWVWVLMLVALNAVLLIRGLEFGAKVNTVLLTLQLSSILVFIGLAIKFVFIDGNGTAGFSMEGLFQAEYFDWKFIATAVSIAVVGFLGIDGLSALSAEAKNPTRNIGLSMILTIISLGTIYMVQGYITGLAHPDYSTLDPDLGMFQISEEIGGKYFYAWIVIINVIAFGFSCAGGVQTALSRILYSMGRDKLLPKFLGEKSEKYGTPVNAAIVISIISIFSALFAPTTAVLAFMNFGAVTAYVILNISVIYYFYYKQKRRGLKGLTYYVIFPLIGFIACGFAWLGFDKTTYILGFAWVLLGVLVGAITSKGYRVTPEIKDL